MSDGVGSWPSPPPPRTHLPLCRLGGDGSPSTYALSFPPPSPLYPPSLLFCWIALALGIVFFPRGDAMSKIRWGRRVDPDMAVHLLHPDQD